MAKPNAAANVAQKVQSDKARNIWNYFFNSLETQLSRLKAKGIDVTGISLLPPFLRTHIENALRNVVGLGGLDIAKTVVEGTLATTIADTRIKNPLLKMTDVFFDAARDKVMSEADPIKAQAELKTATDATFESKEWKDLEKYLQEKSPKAAFATIEARLKDVLRIKLLDWALWMAKYDPKSYKKFLFYRDKIDNESRLKFVLAIKAAMTDVMKLPTPPANPPPGYNQMIRDTRKRIAYLEETLPGPSWHEILMSAAKGEKTPQTRALEDRLEKTRKGFETFSNRHRKAAAIKRSML